MKIASLLPSTTEIICALGLEKELVAITHECDYPSSVESIPKVTWNTIDHTGKSSAEIDRHIRAHVHEGSSLYGLDQEKLTLLEPDLILTQELCKVCAVSYEQVTETVRLIGAKSKTISLEPRTLQEILNSIEDLGKLTGTEAQARKLLKGLNQRIEQVETEVSNRPNRPRVLCLEWLDPPMVGGHWVPDMIRLAGAEDILGRPGDLSYNISWPEISRAAPEVIIVMPCGFHLGETITEFQRTVFPEEWLTLPAVKSGSVFAVDGSSHFNRPGPRIIDGVEVLFEILHGSKSPLPDHKFRFQKLS
jgi:iron complex transport system substrate-binding protein